MEEGARKPGKILVVLNGRPPKSQIQTGGSKSLNLYPSSFKDESLHQREVSQFGIHGR